MNRCLFLDDWHVARAEGLELQAHPGVRHPGNPLMAKKYPWEAARLQLYGQSIVFNPEKKLYQMFYLSMPSNSHYPNLKVGGVTKVGSVTLPSYAESKDGIHWERPLRRDVPFEGIAETNLLDLVEGQSFEAGILRDDRDSDPRRRYKAFVWDQHYDMPVAGKLNYVRNPTGTLQQILDENGRVLHEQLYNNWGIRVAFSADGLRWRKHPGWAIPCYSDTGQSVLYDEPSQKYIAFGRFNRATFTSTDVTYGKKTGAAFNIGRNVARVESGDFLHWSEPELVLSADERDPESFQINSMPVDRYEGIYIGLMEVDTRPRPNSKLPLQLATSRDSRHWTRVAQRAAFIGPAAPGSWDETSPTGWIRPAGNLVTVQDRVRMYYCAGTTADSVAGVGMATWRRDGFVSLHAGATGGELLTRPFVPDGADLHLNIDASQGEVTVRVCDMQGRPYQGWKVSQPSDPAHGDLLDTVVRWRDSDFGDRIGKPVTLRVAMRNADLYAFWT
jgi:hypothetical protein